jgi:diguanylate cyclase (GGDEF)-like protein
VSAPLTPTQRRIGSVLLDAVAVACLLGLGLGGPVLLWIDAAYAAVAAGVLVRLGGITSILRALGVTAAIAAADRLGVAMTSVESAHAAMMLGMAVILGAHVEWQHRAEARASSAARAAVTQGNRAAAVIDIAGQVATSLDLEQVLRRFVDRTRGLFAVDRIQVSRLDAETDGLVTLVEWIDGSPLITPHGRVFALADYPLTRRVLEGRTPAQVRVADPAADPAERALLEARGLGSLLMMPLLVDDRVIGLVEIVARDDRVFTDEEIDLSTELARLAAAAIHNAMSFEDAFESSLHDAATGLRNRRYFDEHLRAELARAERAGTTVALVMLDLDGLKKVNDGLGHHAGDAMLRAAADAMRRVVRESDAACRVGGDEFALILPGADAEAARQVAERVRSRFARAGDYALSAGVAVFPFDAAGAERLCRAADAAAYASKAAGGGRTTVVGRTPVAA